MEENKTKTSVYKPFVTTKSSHQQAALEVQDSYIEILPDASAASYLDSENEDEVETETVSETAISVQAAIAELVAETSPTLSGWWLKAAQTILLSQYCQSKGYSGVEKDVLFDSLAALQADITDSECLVLAHTMSKLIDDGGTTFTADESLPLTAQVASLLLQVAQSVFETHAWMQRCLQTYVAAKTTDEELTKMYSQVFCRSWSGYQWKRMFDALSGVVDSDTHMHILHLIQTYSIVSSKAMNALDSPQTMLETIKSSDDTSRDTTTLGPQAVSSTVESNDTPKDIDTLIDEMRSMNNIDEETLTLLKNCALIAQLYLNNNAPSDLNVQGSNSFNETMEKVKSDLQRAKDADASISEADYGQILGVVSYFCKENKTCNLRYTQLIACQLLLLSAKESSNVLLEVATGEGKTAMLAMFAVMLALQGKHVDIVTSSPILAVRDAKEWKAFYEIFGLTVAHNTNLDREENANLGDVLYESYKANIVYGTVGHFAGDILRQEFEYDYVRVDRRFDAVLVDEVDMLMLDEGVQFTYLSHEGAVLRHIEPVVAAVWGIIGPLTLTRTTAGQNLYAGSVKLFTQAIYECLDPEFSEVESHDQILGVAQSLGIITSAQYDILIGDDQLAKKTTIDELTIDNALSLIAGLEDYQNMPEFLAYRMNSENILEQANFVTDEDSAEAILLLVEGKACVLSTEDKIVDRAVAIIKSKLNFSDSEIDDAINLPNLMEHFVISQLSTYVKNALRALHMEQDREYTVVKGKIVPVDFENSGVIELNKKWGGGLQQMLEIKHNISLTPISLVTNFMSNIEFFSRYKRNGGIYGMSGTLGLDEYGNTAEFLRDMYDTKVCRIPTYKPGKLIEKPAIIVDGEVQWFQQIVSTVREGNREISTWKGKRATLILCEDIKTAQDLRKYIVEIENWDVNKVHLYAHSSSKYLFSFTQRLEPGEIIIATNLASRGTNVKVTNDIKANGGLQCLVTFLARNRRVELQAFGRTAREGLPGSAQCILNYSTMPPQYSGLKMEEIRSMRAEEEVIRIQELMDYNVKEVQLKEKLFKDYCGYLEKVHGLARGRHDKKQIVDSVNEAWAMWLEGSSDDIVMLREDSLVEGLKWKKILWKPANLTDAPTKIDLRDIIFETGRVKDVHPQDIFSPLMSSAANFYHLIQSGNGLYLSERTSDLKEARAYYTKSIELEPRYTAIAYYNRAYAGIMANIVNYKVKARDDIQAAINSMDLYTAEVSIVAQFSAMVRKTQELKSQEVEYEGEEETVPDFATQTATRFEILRFLKEQMNEALAVIDSAEGGVRAKKADLFSLIPDPDYAVSLELARMYSLGLEIVYTVEEIPQFCWEGLVIFLLGLAQIVAGALLVAFTAGAASQFGLALIGEGISDCIDGIEGMITGEFSWAEWAITKATGIALSLATGGISRLATTGLKAIKAGYKIAKTVRQLRAIPKIISSTSKNAAKANMKTVAKYVGTEAVLQGVSYATAKLMNLALQEVTKQIGQKLRESFMPIIQTAFTSGYLGEVVDQCFVVDLTTSYRYRSDVSYTMKERAKKLFDRISGKAREDLNSNSEVKERLATSCLTFFSQLSQKSRELRGLANLAEAAIVLTIVTEAVASLNILVDKFPGQMETVSRQFVDNGTITMSTKSAATYRTYTAVTNFKKYLADQVGDKFATAVDLLLQGKLRPIVNQYQLTNKMGRFTNKVIGKYILKSDRTMEEIKSMQHANYLRAVGFDTSGAAPLSKTNVAKAYAQGLNSADTPGSLMELRIAADYYGQKVTIYTDKNGRPVKDSTIIPSVKKTNDEVELVFVPPSSSNSVGHYDVMIRGVRMRVQADRSNCLFHAYAYSRNTRLSREQLRIEATRLRETVASSITSNPGKYAEHINLRVKMDNLHRGKQFAMVGGGPPNAGTRVLDGFYKQKLVGDKIYTMYEQANGVQCQAWRKYNKNLTTDSKGIVQETDARLTDFETKMTGLNLATAAGTRCYHTKPVVGMVKRPKGDPKDTEVSYHLVPSRAGANAGDQYSNAIPASPHYNNLEKYIWSKPLKDALNGHDFTMIVRAWLCWTN